MVIDCLLWLIDFLHFLWNSFKKTCPPQKKSRRAFYLFLMSPLLCLIKRLVWRHYHANLNDFLHFLILINLDNDYLRNGLIYFRQNNYSSAADISDRTRRRSRHRHGNHQQQSHQITATGAYTQTNDGRIQNSSHPQQQPVIIIQHQPVSSSFRRYQQRERDFAEGAAVGCAGGVLAMLLACCCCWICPI